ncbi:hypothetical protein HYW94_03285 [Candidatus Uhrbacteria bacterium]|nr:hypothetical protein [Candidatus Uhrbacteria bacterium]
MRNIKLYGATAIVLFAVALIGTYLETREWSTQKFPEIGVQMKVPKVIKEGSINLDDKKAKVLFRGEVKKEDHGTPLLIILRYEDGLRMPATVSHLEIIPMLMMNLERAYPGRFPDYKKKSEKKFEYRGKKAAEVDFTYTGPAGEMIKQRFLMVEYDGDTALYFSAQAREEDFEKLNKKYFNRMFSSIRFK